MTSSVEGPAGFDGVAAVSADWSDTAPWIRFGGRMLAALASGAVLGLAFVLSAPRTPVHGHIIAGSPSIVVRAELDGAIATTLVQLGEFVEAGQTLLLLDDLGAQASAAALDAEMLSDRIQEARLLAELDLSDAFAAPTDVAGSTSDIARVVSEQTAALHERRDARVERRQRLSARLTAANGAASDLDKKLIAKLRERDLNEREMSAIGPLYANGIANPQRIGDLQRRSVKIGSDIAALKTKLALAAADRSEIETQLASVDQRFRELAADELQRLRVRMLEHEVARSQIGERAEQVAITSPAAGYVEKFPAGLGAKIVRGEPIVEISPGGGGFSVAAPVAPDVAIGRGSPVTVLVKARGGLAPVRFAGRVRTVSAQPGATATIDVSRGEAMRRSDVLTPAPGDPAEIVYDAPRAVYLSAIVWPAASPDLLRTTLDE